MSACKQKGSKNCWYKFTWRGRLIRGSTKQPNKRVAEQMEAAQSYLLRDVATILLDCALRPEECFRLLRDELRDDALHVPPHLPDALGHLHGPVHARLPGRAQRLLNNAPLRPSAGRNRLRADGAGRGWAWNRAW